MRDNPQERRAISVELSGSVQGDVDIAGGNITKVSVENLTIAQKQMPLKFPILPPEPYYAHYYGGTHFTGRSEKLKILTEWAERNDEPLMVLIAMGGMGKSALVWHWTRQNIEKFDGTLWWSFHEAPFIGFLDAALIYLSKGQISPEDYSTGDKVIAVSKLLNETRCLVILDGFEAELEACRGLNFIYRSNQIQSHRDTTSRSRCVHPQASNFLRRIGGEQTLQSRIILISRLLPDALTDEFGAYLGGTRVEDLVGLQPHEATKLFYNLGIRGDEHNIIDTCDQYDYHPLSLRLLAGFIVNRDPSGDISVASEYTNLEEDLVTNQQHILQVAYQDLSHKQSQFLAGVLAEKHIRSIKQTISTTVESQLPPIERSFHASARGEANGPCY